MNAMFALELSKSFPSALFPLTFYQYGLVVFMVFFAGIILYSMMNDAPPKVEC